MGFSFEVKKHFKSIATGKRHSIDINIISWNNKEDKLDIRRWEDTGKEKRPLKGISLTRSEAEAVYDELTEVLKNNEY